jgi:TPP-dependent pyruvate/acetoin dehydrogenase alpha subunit
MQQHIDALQARVHLCAGYDAMRTACQAALRALDTYNSMYRHHMTVQLISARANLRDVLANVDNEGV